MITRPSRFFANSLARIPRPHHSTMDTSNVAHWSPEYFEVRFTTSEKWRARKSIRNLQIQADGPEKRIGNWGESEPPRGAHRVFEIVADQPQALNATNSDWLHFKINCMLYKTGNTWDEHEQQKYIYYRLPRGDLNFAHYA